MQPVLHARGLFHDKAELYATAVSEDHLHGSSIRRIKCNMVKLYCIFQPRIEFGKSSSAFGWNKRFQRTDGEIFHSGIQVLQYCDGEREWRYISNALKILLLNMLLFAIKSFTTMICTVTLEENLHFSWCWICFSFSLDSVEHRA